MHVVVVRSVDEVVLQSVEIDKVGETEEADEVIDEVDEEVMHVEVRLMS